MSKNGRRPSLTIGAKVSNETNSRYWSATSRTSIYPDEVVFDEDEITDGDNSRQCSRPSSRLSNRPFSNTSQKSDVSTPWCGSRCKFNLWCEGACNKSGALIGLLSSIATIAGLVLALYQLSDASSTEVGKN